LISNIHINLLPLEYRPAKQKVRFGRNSLILIICFFGVFLLFFLWYLGMMRTQLLLTKQIDTLNEEIRENRSIALEISRLEKQYQQLDAKLEGLRRISVDRTKWVILLELFARSLPAASWLTDVYEEGAYDKKSKAPNPAVYLKGFTRSLPEIAVYMSTLEEKDEIERVELLHIEHLAGQEKVLEFEIACHLPPVKVLYEPEISEE